MLITVRITFSALYRKNHFLVPQILMAGRKEHRQNHLDQVRKSCGDVVEVVEVVLQTAEGVTDRQQGEDDCHEKGPISLVMRTKR